MERAGLVPRDPRAVWYGDAPEAVPNPGNALPVPGEGAGRQRKDLAGAVMEPGTISSFQPRTMMSLPRSTGMGLPGQGISAGWRHQTVLQPLQTASLAGKGQKG